MSHNSSATVQVTNNFKYAADITINHTYDNSPAESQIWKDVMPATTTNPDMVVTFNLGWGHFGHDYWQAEVTVKDGPNKGRYLSNVAQCTLHGDDNGAVLTLSVSLGKFVVTASENNDSKTWSTQAAPG